MKRRKKDPRENKNILHVTYGVVGVFAALTLYFGYFIQFRSEEVINNSYNARLNSFADRIVRGRDVYKRQSPDRAPTIRRSWCS